MGHRQVEQTALFYEFSLERHVPADHLPLTISCGPSTGLSFVLIECTKNDHCTNSLRPDRAKHMAKSHFSRRGVSGEFRGNWPGYCKSFNGKLRDECLNGEIFYSLKEATVVIEQWRKHYNTRQAALILNYRPPAPQTSTAKSLQLDRSRPMQ